MLSIDKNIMVDTPSMFKKHLVLTIIRNGNCVFTFQTMHIDVTIPDFLQKQNQHLTTFEVGLNMQPVPIKNLRIDDGGIAGTLSFNNQREQHYCFVPWDAITSIRAKDKQLFDNIDLAKKIKAEFTPKSKTSQPQKNKQNQRSKKPMQLPNYLRVIK